MLGRNHAVYAAAGWIGAWPALNSVPGVTVDTTDFVLFATTSLVAAGAGVVPDLDHPDARPSKHFGFLSKAVSKTLAEASGGHRFGTHSLLFAALLGVLSWGTWMVGGDIGKSLALIACSFCASVGLALVGPTLGFRIPPLAGILAAVWPGWYVWNHFESIGPLLWLLASGGVLMHIACDAVTKGGVPLFWPAKRKYKLGLFRVAGPGEAVAGFLGICCLGVAVWAATTA